MNKNGPYRNDLRPKIVGLAGSLRPESYTRFAVKIALEGAEEAGAETRLLDLRDYDLPFSSGNSRDSSYPADVYRLREEIRQADGIILGTPEYHGGMSGVLKNAIDLMGSQEFESKMIGLVGVSGGAMGANNALVSLRNIARSLHAWVTPKQVSIPQAWRKFDEDGRIHDNKIKARLVELGQEVAHYASLFAADKRNLQLQQWESVSIINNIT